MLDLQFIRIGAVITSVSSSMLADLKTSTDGMIGLLTIGSHKGTRSIQHPDPHTVSITRCEVDENLNT